MSIIFDSISSPSLMSRVTTLKSSSQVSFANYYGMNDSDECEYFQASHTILIRKKEQDFFRLYIVSTDDNELMQLVSQLDSNKYVLNLPSKGDVTEQKEFLIKAGFSFIGAYNRYYNNHIINRDCDEEEFADENDFEEVKQLLYDNFSFYTDHLPSENELQSMIRNHNVIVNRFDDGKVGGFVIHTIEGKKAYINAWLDKTGNGLRLMFQTYNVIERQGIKYAYLWINAQNRNVIVLHKMMGAKPDGLADYSFIKQ